MQQYNQKKQFLPLTKTKELAIVEWSNDKSFILGYGIDDDCNFHRIDIPTQFGLFVGIKKAHYISIFSRHPNIKGIEYIKTDIFANDTTPLDEIFNQNETNKMILVKLCTYSFPDSKKLYNEFNSSNFQFYCTLPVSWNLELFMLLERIYIEHKEIKACHFNNNILYYDKFSYVNNKLIQKPHHVDFIPIISFDVETVSPLKERVPTGELFSDVCFSIAFTMELTPNNVEHLILVNLPAIDSNNVSFENTIIFNNERDMLIKAFEILSFDKHFICIGYNSAQFDMPYLMNRAYLLRLYNNCDKFVYQNGCFAYGLFMVHLDLYYYSVKYFELDSYKLNTVAKHVLNEEKVDINAVNLRYVYDFFCKSDKINHTFVFDDEQFDLETAIRYNIIDTKLVYDIFTKSKMLSSLQDLSKSYILNWNRIIHSRSNENYINKMFRNSCSMGKMFAINHNIKSIICPDGNVLKCDNSKLISKDINDTSKFCGGMNYVDGRNREYDILACDYTAFYPYLIAHNNLSHETTMIATVREIKPYWDIVKEKCTAYYFVDRRGDSNFDTQIKCRQIITGFTDNGSEVKDLKNYKNTDRLLLILKSNNGLLSQFINNQNKIRDASKNKKKDLETLIEEINQRLLQLMIKENKTEEESEDEESEDEEEDEDEEDYELQDEEKEEKSIDLSILDLKIKLKNIKKMDKIELSEYKTQILGELSRILAYYRTLKKENSSYYGLVGSLTSLRGWIVAWSIAFMAAKFITQTAKECQKLNSLTLFVDTDSVFLKPLNNTIDIKRILPQRMESINKALKLNVKIYNSIDIFAKKTYIATKEDEIFSRGINKNGPILWQLLLNSEFLKYTPRNKVDVKFSDLENIFIELYDKMYEKIKENIKLSVCTSAIKEISEYKNNGAIKAMLERELSLNPQLQFGKKISYVHVYNTLPTKTFYVSSHRINELKPSDINLYKLLSKIMNYVKKIIIFNVNETMMKEYNLLFDIKREVDKIELRSYIKHRNKFIDESNRLQLKEINNDDILEMIFDDDNNQNN